MHPASTSTSGHRACCTSPGIWQAVDQLAMKLLRSAVHRLLISGLRGKRLVGGGKLQVLIGEFSVLQIDRIKRACLFSNLS